MPATRHHATTVRRVRATDAGPLAALLAEPLNALYPDSTRWLARKLNDLNGSAATGYVADARHTQLAGVLIASPKRPGVVKINTLFVASNHRNSGVGRTLLRTALTDLTNNGISEAYVTVAHHLATELEAVLYPAGFTYLTEDANRYGPGRHERVYTSLRTLASPLAPTGIDAYTPASW